MGAKTEVELRREAVRRRLAGESPAEIARSLGRTRQWVAKWVGRHDPANADWARGAKRGQACPQPASSGLARYLFNL